MKIEVLLFAAARDVFGGSKIDVELAVDATVAVLKTELARLVPAGKDVIGQCAISVDHQYATDETMIKTGQEVAVIPPVSGG